MVHLLSMDNMPYLYYFFSPNKEQRTVENDHAQSYLACSTCTTILPYVLRQCVRVANRLHSQSHHLPPLEKVKNRQMQRTCLMLPLRQSVDQQSAFWEAAAISPWHFFPFGHRWQIMAVLLRSSEKSVPSPPVDLSSLCHGALS